MRSLSAAPIGQANISSAMTASVNRVPNAILNPRSSILDPISTILGLSVKPIDITRPVQFFDESEIGKIFGVGVFRRRQRLRQIIQDRFKAFQTRLRFGLGTTPALC